VIPAERAALLANLQERLGYTFRDQRLLDCALTHTSYMHEAAEASISYERLEFLGDAVLGLIVSTYLYTTYPSCHEGQLSKLRARIVSRSGLAALARQFELGDFLLLGRGEERTGGRAKPSLLAAALEAVIGAMYLDGGLAVAQDTFLRSFGPTLTRHLEQTQTRDYKGLLQEQALSAFRRLPTYRVMRELGPPHRRTFYVQVRLADYRCVGVGRSKKAAEQHAAQQLLEQIPGDGVGRPQRAGEGERA
jgi:ribonuclease-3